MISTHRFKVRTVYHEYYDSPLLRSIFTDPDAYLTDQGYKELYKHDRTTTVAMVSDGSQKLVIKRYNTKNFLHVIRRSVRSTRAANCWQLAHRFKDIGIAIAPPVAIIEERFGPLRGRSYYVAEHVNGDHCLAYLSRNTDGDHIIHNIKRIFSVMLAHRISHGDLKATNLLISNERVVLLDLDAATEHRFALPAARAYRRDRSRFLRNWDTQSCMRRRLEKEIPKLPD